MVLGQVKGQGYRYCNGYSEPAQLSGLRVSRVIRGSEVRIPLRVKNFLTVSEMRGEVLNSFTKKEYWLRLGNNSGVDD